MSDIGEIIVRISHIERQLAHVEGKLDAYPELAYDTKMLVHDVDELQERTIKLEKAMIAFQTYAKIWGVLGPMIGSALVAAAFHFLGIK